MESKYCVSFSDDTIQLDKRRLINQLWKLIPMRENNENWEEHLAIVIEEVSGLSKVINKELDFLVLLSKLEGLTFEVCKDFMIYRKTIFRCIELLTRLLNHE